jgi:hypothetical protein
MEAEMNKAVVGAIIAAAVLAMPYGVGMAAERMPGGVEMGGKYYPPCTSRNQDNCVQVPMRMRERMHAPAKKMRMHKQPMMRKGASMTPEVPHGCSPVTTPCE